MLEVWAHHLSKIASNLKLEGLWVFPQTLKFLKEHGSWYLPLFTIASVLLFICIRSSQIEKISCCFNFPSNQDLWVLKEGTLGHRHYTLSHVRVSSWLSYPTWCLFPCLLLLLPLDEKPLEQASLPSRYLGVSLVMQAACQVIFPSRLKTNSVASWWKSKLHFISN